MEAPARLAALPAPARRPCARRCCCCLPPCCPALAVCPVVQEQGRAGQGRAGVSRPPRPAPPRRQLRRGRRGRHGPSVWYFLHVGRRWPRPALPRTRPGPHPFPLSAAAPRHYLVSLRKKKEAAASPPTPYAAAARVQMAGVCGARGRGGGGHGYTRAPAAPGTPNTHSCKNYSLSLSHYYNGNTFSYLHPQCWRLIWPF